MELYTLDALLRREAVIDTFESLIWTERFNQFGDFEVKVKSTLETRALLKKGVRLAMNESYRVMTVETIEDGLDADGVRMRTVRGNSMESVLLDRVAKSAMAGVATWDLEDVPAAIMRKVFHDICVTGVLNPKDILPFVIEGTIMPTSTIAEPIDPIVLPIPISTVYDVLKGIGEVWNLGFRLLRNFDTSQVYWDVYSGSDRTTAQTTRPPVVFAPNLDNLQDTSEFVSIESSKNVAYVFSPDGYLEVYPQDSDPGEITGLDRRVLLVDANDITSENTTDIPAALLQRGLEELSRNREVQAFDGEISQFSQYKYQRDYFLGDLVEQRNEDGVANYMRVTEQIFASDKEGERSYPTLVKNQFVSTGSWLSERALEWIDYDADPITWSEKP